MHPINQQIEVVQRGIESAHKALAAAHRHYDQWAVLSHGSTLLKLKTQLKGLRLYQGAGHLEQVPFRY